VIATDCAVRKRFTDAFEHAFLERYGIGEFGEYCEAADAALAEAFSQPGDPAMRCLREFRHHYDEGMAKADDKASAADALNLLYAAQEALERGGREAPCDYVYLRELKAEAQAAICEIQGGEYGTAIQAFEDVLRVMPEFVPARVQLARIALLQGDRQRAHTIWQQAYSMMPFHSFVFNFREHVEAQNPETMLTSRPASSMFSQEGRDS
jgi:tetratricopeptide (TPR) repeat protein